jgi:hypothetical protein
METMPSTGSLRAAFAIRSNAPAGDRVGRIQLKVMNVATFPITGDGDSAEDLDRLPPAVAERLGSSER